MKKFTVILFSMVYIIMLFSSISFAQDNSLLSSIDQFNKIIEKISKGETKDFTELMIEIQNSNIDRIKELLDKKVNVNQKSSLGLDTLSLAITKGDMEVVNLLIAAGANPNSKIANNLTPLMIAAITNNVEAAKLLIDNNVDINAKTTDKFDALIIAATKGNTEITKMLLDLGANVKAEKSMALMKAIENSDLALIKLLVEKGADVNTKLSDDGSTPLMVAVSKCDNIEILKYLVEKGANVNAKNVMGDTPLMFSISTGNVEFVKFLLDNRANKNIKNNYGQTPFSKAKLDKYDEIAKMLEK